MGSTESIICMIVLLVVFLVGFTESQDLQYLQAYIKRKEDQVKEMAAEIVRLDDARCDLVANCSSLSCSRHACTATEGFDDPNIYNFTCQDQDKPNEYCHFSGHDCNGRKLNYAMSYIRMAPNIMVSHMPNTICSTICMSRDFTTTLKHIASVDNYHEQFYFGSVDGTSRFFPGEESPNTTDAPKCFNYDPRRRRWYNGAISMETYLIVLIDNSYAAGNLQSESPSLLSTMDASKQIVQQLIQTLSSNDILDVITFNEKTATPLTPNPVFVGDDGGSGELKDGRKEFLGLISNIASTQGGLSTSYVGFIQAISTAFQRIHYNNDSQFIVMLVLTNGEFVADLQLPADRQPITGMLNNHSTNLFIYSFKDAPNLQALANESGGYYEFLTNNFDNPLYQINSLFNFMALARNESDDKPYWTMYYEDYGGRGNVITVSYRALSPMGHLVGVTAIDIISESVLQDLPNLLQDKLGSRPTNSSPLINPARIVATNYGCGKCNGLEAVCAKSSSKSFVELQCCDTCISKSNKMSADKIAIATVVPAVGVLAFFISVVWWLRKKRGVKNNTLTTELGPYE